MFGPRFVMQYFVFCNHPVWEERAAWLFAFYCLRDVMLLLLLFASYLPTFWSVVYDCGISWSYLLAFLINFTYNLREDTI